MVRSKAMRPLNKAMKIKTVIQIVIDDAILFSNHQQEGARKSRSISDD